jgi:two-component system, LytTR family, response regulator
MRAVVVDNERHARDELGHLLSELGDVEVVASCANAVEALQAVNALLPDVLFLDIQMPQVSGFELLGMIDEAVLPDVVFVTAYDEFALRAFEENALDYLLKPVQPERLARAVEKVRRFAGEARPPSTLRPGVGRVPCSGPSSIRLVDVEDIEFVRSSAAGVYVVTAEAELFTEGTLRVLETRTGVLSRCHKQYLVNLQRVEAIVRADDGTAALRMRSGRTVPVSRRLLLRLKDAFGIKHRQSRG